MNKTTIKSDRYQQDEMLSAIYSADSVLLFCHISPDGDTLGSALALRERLLRMHKNVQVIVDGAVPSLLEFLPGVDALLTAEQTTAPFDLALAIDVAAADRLGACEPLFTASPVTALIDHHGTNPAFAKVNMIDGQAPAAAILVYRLLQQMDLPLNKAEALCLYTALSTDTGNFVYESTDAESFTLMSDLMEAGLPLSEYSRRLFRQKELPFVRLLGEVLPTLRICCSGLVAGLTLTLEQMEHAHANAGHTDSIVNYAIDIEGVKAAYFVRELPDGGCKVSLRALPPCAVDTVAARLGGGGHKLAAGVTLNMALEQAVKVLEKALSEAVHE